MERTKVKSSIIKTLGYDKEALLLEVEFHNSEVHRFINIPVNIFENMMKSPSKGAYFIQNISNNYPRRYIRKKKFTII